jgi:galactokinase
MISRPGISPERLRSELGRRLGSGGEPRLFFAPGRVNLLGAHLDYNGGFVLPGAIDRGTWLLARTRADRRVRMASLNFDPRCEIELGELGIRAMDPRRGWANYPLGVLHHFALERTLGSGLDLLYAGDLPIGSGLSSSASIGLVTAFALDAISGAGYSIPRLAELVVNAENDYVGVRCGIMDPYACGLARSGRLLFVDCKSLEVRHLPFDPAVATIAVTDTGLRRSLTDGRFNERVAECRQALERLRREMPHLETLRDLRAEELERLAPLLSPALARRARHVVAECQRCLEGARALERGDYPLLGRMLDRSHASSRDDYEVSCPELDFIVECGGEMDAVLGSRLTGAGFGGCVVSLVRRGEEEPFREEMERRYRQRFARRPRIYLFRTAAGVREILGDSAPRSR